MTNKKVISGKIFDVNKEFKGQGLDVSVSLSDQGIAIGFQGFYELTGGEPLYIELVDGNPSINIWDNIKQDDPTTITLKEANGDNATEGEFDSLPIERANKDLTLEMLRECEGVDDITLHKIAEHLVKKGMGIHR